MDVFWDALVFDACEVWEVDVLGDAWNAVAPTGAQWRNWPRGGLELETWWFRLVVFLVLLTVICFLALLKDFFLYVYMFVSRSLLVFGFLFEDFGPCKGNIYLLYFF